MSMLLLCYPSCSTCARARKWLDDHGVSYEERNIKADNPTAAELEVWHRMSGLPLRRLFNTSGVRYRAMALKDRLDKMTVKEQLELLSTDGMLVKRPLLIGGNFVLVGFRQNEWESKLLFF